MWIDADAIFTNFTIKIESIIHQLKQDDYFIISEDFPGGNCVNAGIWIVKNNNEGKNLIDLIEKSYPYYKNNIYPEQQAMQDILFSYITAQQLINNSVPPYEPRSCPKDRILAHVQVLPQRALNSYYTSYALGKPTASWQPGDFIAHVAGGVDKTSLIKRLTSCMKKSDLSGCEVDGSWQEHFLDL